MTYAPIAIFAYRRPKHLARLLDSLENCKISRESPTFVFCDGPRDTASEVSVRAVRKLLEHRRRPNMEVRLQQENRGLANSVISGVTELCRRYGRVIVLEDDLVLETSALTWFNQVLDQYAMRDNVFHVNGFQYDVPELRRWKSGLASNFISSWGWATWSRAWAKFDGSARGWEKLLTDKELAMRFDHNGNFPLSRMLIEQMGGRSDSWAIRWCWTCFRESGLSVSPPRSLITNWGFDSTASHNSIGWLKRFFAPSMKSRWTEDFSPAVPFDAALDPNVQKFIQRALKKTGATRNAAIKDVARRFGILPRHDI